MLHSLQTLVVFGNSHSERTLSEEMEFVRKNYIARLLVTHQKKQNWQWENESIAYFEQVFLSVKNLHI